MAAFKDGLGPEAARRLSRELAKAWGDFPSRKFGHRLPELLEPLELMARNDALAQRLESTLPTSFGAATAVLYRALESPTFVGWIVLPCGVFVARAGIDFPAEGLPLLSAMTERGSSEFAIRPFIERHRDETYEHLAAWVTNENEHIRRLVSEGTRPRLPWARQLRFLIDDPSPNLALLERLVDDPSAYVRRSVANHLNDISKDHPDLALHLGTKWLARGETAEALVRHGLRTLIKRGNREALKLFGAGDDRVELIRIATDKERLPIGDSCEITITLQLPADADSQVDTIVDYRVHYIGSRGATKAPKVFKLARPRLNPGTAVTLRKRHSFDHVSIRRIHPGPHRIDVQVNGSVLGHTMVEVVLQ